MNLPFNYYYFAKGKLFVVKASTVSIERQLS